MPDDKGLVYRPDISRGGKVDEMYVSLVFAKKKKKVQYLVVSGAACDVLIEHGQCNGQRGMIDIPRDD